MGMRTEERDKVVKEYVHFRVCDLCKTEVQEAGSDPPVTWASVVHRLDYSYSEGYVICDKCFAKLGLKRE